MTHPLPGQPPHAAGPPPVAPPPARRSRLGLIIAAAVSLVALFGLCCGGVLVHQQWYQPRQQMEQRREIVEDLGVPDHFTRVKYEERDEGTALASISVAYRIECTDSTCSADLLAHFIEPWLTDAGLKLTTQDVRRCVTDPYFTGCKVVRTERDGFHLLVSTAGTVPQFKIPGYRASDYGITIRVTVGAPVD